MNNLDRFLEERQIKKAVGDAFVAYCRFKYHQQYDLLKTGDTVKTLISAMTEKQVLDAWNEFIKDLRDTLS